MLEYLVILLDDTSISYCHVDNPIHRKNLMPLKTLKEAIVFGMKENLMIQYVMPSYQLPEEYLKVMEMIDNIKIGADIQIYNSIPTSVECDTIALRIRFQEFINSISIINSILPAIKRLNVIYTNIEEYSDEWNSEYASSLSLLEEKVFDIIKCRSIEVNLLTDRLRLTEMHNCGAGVNNITVAPNGRFYICPAFYYDEVCGIDNKLHYNNPQSDASVGDLTNGLSIPNRHLLSLKYSPLCRECDAYHCNRCIWLNCKTTWECNTPSHQQCVMAHIERNASQHLSMRLKIEGMDAVYIEDIDYLDPFYNKKRY